MKREIYRGWLIDPIFVYASGVADWHIYPDAGNEPGQMAHKQTAEEIKALIDTIIEDLDA